MFGHRQHGRARIEEYALAVLDQAPGEATDYFFLEPAALASDQVVQLDLGSLLGDGAAVSSPQQAVGFELVHIPPDGHLRDIQLLGQRRYAAETSRSEGFED